jgi:choline dehydrogenase-like flavoprotein
MASQSLSPTPISRRHTRLFLAIVHAAIPPGEVLNLPVESDDMVYKLGLTLASMPPEGRIAVRLALWFFEWGSLLFHARPFTSLDEQAQGRWLARWTESSFFLIRQAARLLLTLVKPVHIGRRAVQAAIGHPPDRLDGVAPKAPMKWPMEQVVTVLERDTEVRCQVVVVGSGAGGAVVAAELAEKGIDVVLVEEGRIHGTEEFGSDPLKILRTTYREGGTTLALGRPAMPVPLGMTVGGSTTINSGTCFRTPERVLQLWEDLGLPVDRTEMDRHFRSVEERLSVQPVPDSLLGGSSHVIARGAAALNLQHGPLKRNIKGCEGSAVCAFGCPREAKQSMNVTYVPDALRAGARLFTGLRAHTVLRDGNRAGGLIASPRGGGPALTVRADAVVSACGSVSGVPFLKGIGLKNRHLGRHLTLHPAAKIAALMPEVVDGWKDTPQGYGITEYADEGLMFEGAFVPPAYASIAMPFVGRAYTEVMERFRHLAMFGLFVSDGPNGRVLRGPDGKAILFYWMSREDLEKVRRGLQILARVFFAAGAERIFLPMAGVESQDTLEEALDVLSKPLDPWALELMAFHPLGTARMSTSARGGVVDSNLQSWEMPGLYVVDGGIFPTSLGVNPQLSIMAWAHRAAEHLAEQVQ